MQKSKNPPAASHHLGTAITNWLASGFGSSSRRCGASRARFRSPRFQSLSAEPLECRALLSATADFDVVNDWGSGFQGEITLANDSNAISGWQLEFDFSRRFRKSGTP